jgi:transcription elongation factor GreA
MMLMAVAEPGVHTEGMKSAQSFPPAVVADGGVDSLGETVPAAQILLGAAEFAAYEEELARLRGLRERKLPERLRAARGFVAADTAEEISHIQEEQTVMDARIARLEDLLCAATVIPDDLASDVATLGSTVEIQYRRTGRRAMYRLTGAASWSDGRGVSARSPVGRALLGRRAGDTVSTELPGGRVEQLYVVAVTAALGEAS